MNKFQSTFTEERTITYEGKTWNQMSKKEQVNSIKACVEHAFDKKTIHHKFICRWLLFHGPKLGLGNWRKILKPIREKVENNESLDGPNNKDFIQADLEFSDNQNKLLC